VVALGQLEPTLPHDHLSCMPLPAADVLRHPSRLAALRATGLLDAPPQDALDRLTRLASRLIGVPIALASLVEADLHVFASEFGLGEPLRTTRKMPLSHSFCQHVVATRKPLVVEDAHAHPLVFDNLAIPDMGVIAYAGMPLTSEDGEVLGSFCAVDTAPRKWSQDQLDTLEDLAHAASAEMQLRAASRLLSQRQTFLADLLDHTSELVCATDERGYIAYSNDAMLATTAYDAEELGRMRFVDLVAAESRGEFMLAEKRARAGEGIPDLATIMITKGGQRIYVRGRGTPVFNDAGAVTGVRVIFRDLTKEREVQRLKDELIALVSHELRTPVGAIRGALKLLAPHVKHLEGKPRQLFEMAARNADRLLTLLNDLLDIERLESGSTTLDRAPVSATVLLEQVREVVQPLADAAKITIVISAEDVDADGDAGRLQQVLVNLVGNALKFSPPGSAVTMTAHAATLGDARAGVCFSVDDKGRGIPADKHERVFERFEQVTATDASEKGGAGLGLAISKTIVEQHGGRIWVESVVGEGSSFRFTVPVGYQHP